MYLSPTPESIPPRNTTKIGKLLVQSSPYYKQQLPFISRLLHWLGVVSKVIWIPSRLMKDYTQKIAEVDILYKQVVIKFTTTFTLNTLQTKQQNFFIDLDHVKAEVPKRRVQGVDFINWFALYAQLFRRFKWHQSSF